MLLATMGWRARRGAVAPWRVGPARAAVMPAGAFAVHQLRYVLAYGGAAGLELQRQGHFVSAFGGAVARVAADRQHPDCQTLVCFVYDPDGRVDNAAALETDLAGVDAGLTTTIIVAPSVGDGIARP
jgi:hypothetical protein